MYMFTIMSSDKTRAHLDMNSPWMHDHLKTLNSTPVYHIITSNVQCQAKLLATECARQNHSRGNHDAH